MKITRLAVAALPPAAALFAAPPAVADDDATGKPPPSEKNTVSIEATNMCMWGPHATHSCFPVDEHDKKAIEADAATNREALVQQFLRHNPDIMTVNEGCSKDLQAVQKTLATYSKAGGGQWDLEMFDTGRGQKKTGHYRACDDGTVDRGITVNAIFARTIVPGSKVADYFEDGYVWAADEHGDLEKVYSKGYRSYLCVEAAGTGAGTVRVCAAHFSLPGQTSIFDKNDAQDNECGVLKSLLSEKSQVPVIFAGDLNRQDGGCKPASMTGLHDLEMSADDRKSDKSDGFQHVYWTKSSLHRTDCGYSYDVEHTDHEGFKVTLATSGGTSDSCIRVLK